MRTFYLFIGIACYTLFFMTFMLLIAFIGNLGINFPALSFLPWNIDSAPSSFSTKAILVNISLILLFGLQHSIMARQGFKQWITQLLPEALERSVYVLLSSIALLLLMAFWQPITTPVWNINHTFGASILWGIFFLGWFMVLFSSFIINHFDLFGLRQVYLSFKNKPYQALPFQVKSLYKIIRHPLYLGVLLGTWAIPAMSIGHLLLALGFTLYIFIGIHFEEQDLVRFFGDKYQIYQKKTAMLLPFFKK